MSSFALGAPAGQTLENFLARTRESVTTTFTTYLNDRPFIKDSPDNTYILDLEHVAHPSGWGTYTDPDQLNVLTAYKMRVEVAREFLPHSKLCAYGVVAPDTQGEADDPTFIARMDAYERAGTLGVYDPLDCLASNLYPRFAPSEGSYQYWEAYTRQGIESSRLLTKSDGTPLEIVPLLNPKVANGGSAFNTLCAPWEQHAAQLSYLDDYPYLRRLVYWMGGVPSGTEISFCEPLALLESVKDALVQTVPAGDTVAPSAVVMSIDNDVGAGPYYVPGRVQWSVPTCTDNLGCMSCQLRADGAAVAYSGKALIDFGGSTWDTLLPSGSDTAYTLDVLCEDRGRNTLDSADQVVTVDVTPPTVPDTPVLTIDSSTQISLSCPASTDGSSGVGSYNILACSGSGCTPVQVGTSQTCAFVHTGLTTGTLYRYEVSAVDLVGNTSAVSAAAEGTTP